MHRLPTGPHGTCNPSEACGSTRIGCPPDHTDADPPGQDAGRRSRPVRTRAASCSTRSPGNCPPALSSEAPALDRLATREEEVPHHIARGCTYEYEEVGARLHLSVKTVETHVSAVLRKLQLSNRHELTAWAADRDLR